MAKESRAVLQVEVEGNARALFETEDRNQLAKEHRVALQAGVEGNAWDPAEIGERCPLELGKMVAL